MTKKSKKIRLSKTGKGLLGLICAAMLLASVGGTTFLKAATASNRASFTLGPGTANNYSTTGKVLKEHINSVSADYAGVTASYVYNQSNKTLYFRVRNATDTDHVSKKCTNTISPYTNVYNYGTTLTYESGANVKVTNYYRLRAAIPGATSGYAATTGTWYP